MDTDSELPTTPGTVIAGKYRVEGVIGEGGMGSIVKARHLTLNRDVAIKLMRSEITGVHKASERFLREARATANIESDYVAHVSDIDLLPSGMPFIVMEFLDGVDLSAFVENKRQRDVTEAVDWMLQTLSGLTAAHSLGIVHRDLKPTNLFVVKRADGSTRIKVLDFGVSKVLNDSDFSREGHNIGLTTASNFVVGTPRYMAPEQITAPGEVDERADLWAVGLILYEFLVGAHPFDGKTPGAIMSHVLATPILPIDAFRADVPHELTRVVERCLQRDRNLRFRTAPELLRALAPFGTPQLAAVLVATLPTPKPARRIESVAVQTPTGSALESVAVPFSVVQPVATLHSSSNAPANVSERKSADAGTLLEWNQDRTRERSKTAMVVASFALLTAVTAGTWFFFARSSNPSPPQYSEFSPVPVHQAVPGASSVPAPAQSAAPQVQAVPAVEPAPEATATQPSAASAPLPPPPKAAAPSPVGGGVGSTKKPKISTPATTKSKDSILGTRN